MSSYAKKQKIKNGLKKSIKIAAYVGASLARPDKVVSKTVDIMMKEIDRNRTSGQLERQYVGKYIFVNPNSSPANVVWGRIEGINLREAGEFDLIIRHSAKGYLQYLRYDNVGNPIFFNSENELLDYVNREYENGNLRVGSFRVTYKGALENGEIILYSLKELVYEDDEIQKLIPKDFLPLISDSYDRFINKKDSKFLNDFNNKKIFELFSKFPFEFLIVNSVINNVFQMRTYAVVTD